MKVILPIGVILLFAGCSDSNPDQPTPREYLDEVFAIVEEHSINRDSLDFPTIRAEAYARLDQASSVEKCYSTVRFILRQLNDHHSFFMEKERVKAWKTTSRTQNKVEVITFYGKLLPENIGYLHLKGFNSGDPVSLRTYSDSLQSLIASIDHQNIDGWIVDLRHNTGGNCWPMLTGLGPLLGEGICGYFVNNNRHRSAWYYQNGSAGIRSSAIVRIQGKPYQLIQDENPIAVLTGSQTASSGEVVVTSFRKKDHTRSFGEPTAGLSTGNANFQLSDGSMIFLTTSIYADREGELYGGPIVPDSTVSFEYPDIGTDRDQVIKEAITWIRQN